MGSLVSFYPTTNFHKKWISCLFWKVANHVFHHWVKVTLLSFNHQSYLFTIWKYLLIGFCDFLQYIQSTAKEKNDVLPNQYI